MPIIDIIEIEAAGDAFMGQFVYSMRTASLNLWALSALALSLAATGCGSSLGACGVVPCGGDVVGTWQAQSACLEHATLEKDFLSAVKGSCPTASIGAVTMTPRGTLTLSADMSFTGDLTVSSTMEVNHPAACVEEASCADVTRILQSQVGVGGITAIDCAGAGACVCTYALTTDIIRASGTWSTSGSMLSFAGAPGGDGPYCVRGSSLHLLGYDLATMSKIVSDIVLTKP